LHSVIFYGDFWDAWWCGGAFVHALSDHSFRLKEFNVGILHWLNSNLRL
jgi:hypothetical protein